MRIHQFTNSPIHQFRSVPSPDAVYKAGTQAGSTAREVERTLIMLKKWIIGALVAASSLSAGCLQKETTHTLYLAPDGSVEWVTSEANVHSDEADAGTRVMEEQGYIGVALLGSHGAARGLAALDPVGSVRTTVVRDQRPFLVLTSARFASVDRVLTRLFAEMQIRSTASLVRGADENSLRVRLDFSRPLEGEETAVSELGDNVEHLRIVLTDGRFGAVSGFDVAEGTSATLSKEWLERAEHAYETKDAIEFALSWN